MKKTKGGFAIFELTGAMMIIPILSTIAFISFQGYSQDAKNSKVMSDIRSLTTAIETEITAGNLDIKDIVASTKTGHSVANGLNTFKNPYDQDKSEMLDNPGTGGNYNVGSIDFIQLGQNSTDFNYDDKGTQREYIAAYAAQDKIIDYYQIAGQITDSSGDYTAVVKGNYIYDKGTDNATGLIADKTGTYSNGVKNNDYLGSKGFY